MRQPGAIELAEENVMTMDGTSGHWSYNPFQHGTVSTERFMSTDIDYIYEIDLDSKIFHINGIPSFALECLPSDEVFLKHVSEDHYRNVACVPECPPEHMYKRPAPPVVENSEFATYRSLVCIGTDVALSDLLGIRDVLSPCEHIRTSLLETIIGQCMTRITRDGYIMKHDVGGTVVATFYQFVLASNHNQLTDQEWSTPCFMANLAFIPQIFDSPTWPRTRSNHQLRKEFTWVREDTVLYIATHLYDERCLLASISRLIDEILAQKDSPGDYFGVAFDIQSYGRPPIFTVVFRRFSFYARHHCSCSYWLSRRPSTLHASYAGLPPLSTTNAAH
ncbi:hypothetical protein AZE42_05647 [Rhizopogon vesiculosus]|uniref:Uncharacterized protein n=1 Tax=Rhizopogon vesiculosus TaxID=180088 RepID=A0A1J8QRK8_9AGAM|nr:hypothetical protein AZE42_05647 [Rhizopogon vesiculosus]